MSLRLAKWCLELALIMLVLVLSSCTDDAIGLYYKLAYDLDYIRSQSALEDLKIILRTLPVMLLGRGGR